MLRITDLALATPAAAWTDRDADIDGPPAPQPSGGWRLIDYLAGDIRGQALQTTRADSAELQIPLPQRGWHAISLALAGHYDQDVIEVRLRGESRWQTLRAGHGGVQEVPWRFTRLHSDSAMELRYPRDLQQLPGRLRSQATSARLFWIRLEAIAPRHIDPLHDERPRPLIYLNDGHSLFWRDAERAGPDVVTRSLRRFAASEWQCCCFCAGGADLVNYPSSVGTPFGADGWDDPWPANHKTARLIRELIDQGEDVLQLAVDTAHAQDHDFWFYLRPQAWVGEPPFDHAFRSRFFTAHPQYRCRNAAGQALGKLSYAFPEVRAQVNAIVAEALDRGADAVGIALVRAMPLVRYEEPVLARFEALYHDDARECADDDPRLRSVWAEFTRIWLTELRGLLDRAGPDRHGRRRRLFLIAGPTPQWHDRFGMDIPPLGRAGLVDAVLPYPEGDEDLDIEAWREWLAGCPSIDLLPGLGNFSDHGLSVARLQRRALGYYQAGADGLNRWDTPGWLVGLNLHRPAWLALWQRHYLGEQDLPLRELAGLWLEEFPPLDGF